MKHFDSHKLIKSFTSIPNQKKFEWCMAACLLVIITYLACSGAIMPTKTAKEANANTIVIDAGHGGFDPGKIGINEAKEKDINLAIAKRLQKYLTEAGFKVIMVRDTDEALYDADASNKKAQDMKRRCTLINEAKPLLAVSIHQNSYPEESIHGAQVFYYQHSTESEAIAGYLQKSMITHCDPDNTRSAKADTSYYLLKNTEAPIVIAECGFLSNYEEAEKLLTEEYQDKMAYAICQGILAYLDGKNPSTTSGDTTMSVH